MHYGLINVIYEKIYELKCRKLRGFNSLSKLMLKLGDPIIKAEINSQDCLINFSHQGVYYMRIFPRYDKNIGIICSCLKKEVNRPLKVIDVGANVGDTILCIGDKENYYYAFEGEQRYYTLLRKNLKDFKYELFTCFCGDNEGEQSFVFDYREGTGSLIANNESNGCEIKRVDSVIDDSKGLIDFVKIDTDGFDFAVIRGMTDLLKKNKPVLYFEWTAPELIRNNEDLLSIFRLLNELDYNSGLLFDKYGNLICPIHTADLDLLSNLIEYSMSADLYYDVCLIHNSSCLDLDNLIENVRVHPNHYE